MNNLGSVQVLHHYVRGVGGLATIDDSDDAFRGKNQNDDVIL